MTTIDPDVKNNTDPHHSKVEGHPPPPSIPSPKVVHQHPEPGIPNIVVFGETGTGKSSLINMLAGKEIAATSNRASGCTFSSKPYSASIEAKYDGETVSTREYRLWDTAGLNEGEHGSVPPEQALEHLHDLVKHLSGSGGVSLLVYCIRGLRLGDIARVNYDLFHGIICQGQVPIVLVVTGLENEENMDMWWTDNERELRKMGMEFHKDGHACVTTSEGKKGKDGHRIFEEEYKESSEKIRSLLVRHCAETWKVDTDEWISGTVTSEALRKYMDQYNRRTGRERDALLVPEQNGRNINLNPLRLWRSMVR